MDLPATLNIDATRKLALKKAITDAAKGMAFEDAYYFTLGCRLGLTERDSGIITSDKTLSIWPQKLRDGRELTLNF